MLVVACELRPALAVGDPPGPFVDFGRVAVIERPALTSGCAPPNPSLRLTSVSFEAKHAAIIARTLAWADQAAARHDYVQAVHWVDTVRGLGQGLPDAYEGKRETWLAAIGRDRRR